MKRLILAVILLLASCASKNKSIGAGGLIGATVGGSIGAIIPEKSNTDRVRNIIIGSAIGGAAGVIMGSAAYSSQNRQKQNKATATSYPTGVFMPPSLKKAKVESRWVEARVLGNRYITGHWEYIISEPASWEEQ